MAINQLGNHTGKKKHTLGKSIFIHICTAWASRGPNWKFHGDFLIDDEKSKDYCKADTT